MVVEVKPGNFKSEVGLPAALCATGEACQASALCELAGHHWIGGLLIFTGATVLAYA